MMNTAIRLGLALAWALALTTREAAAEDLRDARAGVPAGASAEPAQKSTRSLDKAVREQLGSDEEARASQQRIDALDDETLKMLAEYRRRELFARIRYACTGSGML